MKKIGRNDPCGCGSGKKAKHCCQRQGTRVPAALPSRASVGNGVSELLDQALQYHQAGHLQQAEALYQQILQVSPQQPDALHFLGVLSYQAGQPARAVEWIRQALCTPSLHPHTACAMWCNLGLALHVQGKTEAAIDAYRRALALKPEHAEAHNNLGNTLQAQGRLDEAIASYQHALKYRPDYADAHNNLGNAWRLQGHIDTALACYQQALASKPDFAAAYNNRGLAEKALGHFAAAVSSFSQAIHYKPDYAEAHNNLGNLHQEQGQLEASVACYCAALSILPNYAEAHNNLGLTLQQQGKLAAAIERYQTALRLLPDYAQAYSNLGNVYQEQGRLEEAMACHRHAFTLQPELCTAHSNLLFCLNYHPELSAEEIYQEYCQWNRQHAQRLPLTEQHHNPVEPNRRLKIGYVSPDLRQHSTQHFIEPLIVHHDKSQVELYAYAQVAVEDNVSSRLKHHIDHWCNTTGLSDDQLADQIRHDQIDILIDLAGHTRGNRLLTFARKPAPIQATCFGYGYTTGLDRIDYFLADAHYAPQGCESLFAEQIYRLPVAAAYRPASGMGAVNALPAASHGTITFASLSRLVRINARVIHTWAQILKRIPYARLIINSGDLRCADMQQRLQQQFAAHGIPPERLNLGFQSPPWDLLRTIDISLDCFPHNSGTTLYESLYLGVPFITLAARPSVGRIGASILHAVGHPEWIATSESDYIDKAVALASDLPQLARTRAVLRQQMQASRLMDEEGFTRSLEQAYRTLWARWCAQQQDAQNNPHHNPQIKNQTARQTVEAGRMPASGGFASAQYVERVLS